MSFHSVLFLFAFLPAALAVYLLVPARFRNGVLAVENIVFYAWGNLRFLPLLLLLIALDYSAARGIERTEGRKKRVLFWCALAGNLAALIVFKYGRYLAALLAKVSTDFSSLSLFDVLPLGISYFSLKLISYLADVYRGDIPAEKNVVTFTAYAALFSQMIIGPIARWRDLAPYFHDPKNRCSVDRFSEGAEMFVLGLAKKIVLADQIGLVWSELTGETGIGFENASTGLVWLGALTFSLTLYLDFSGYSEMSNGLSLMMGIPCRPNFDLPFRTHTISSFWNHWHISLTTWFRDYVYIPLGGNRRGFARQCLNIAVVWAITAVWHGAALNFLIWGLVNGLLVLYEKRFFHDFPVKHPLLANLYVVLFAMLGFAFFGLNGTAVAPLQMLQKLFVPSGGICAAYYIRSYGLYLLAGVLVSAGAGRWLWEKISKNTALKGAVFCLLFAVSIAYVIGSTSRAALYAGF